MYDVSADPIELPPEFRYQGYIRNRAVKLKRLGVLAKPGAGKTRPIVDMLVELGLIAPGVENKTPKGPILILCTGSAIPTWARQIPLWANDSYLDEWIVPVKSKKPQRRTLWKSLCEGTDGIYIINSSIFWRDYDMIRHVKWAGIVADEYHRYMLRKSSKTFKLFRSLAHHVEVVVMATGSSLRKNPSSMWTLFTITNPRDKLFSSYWRFVETWCIVDDNGFGAYIVGPKNVPEFQKLVDRYHAYVPAEVVAEQVPEGRRQPMYVEMTPSQAKVYNDLCTTMIAELEDDLIVVPNPLAKLLKLRQLLCCPRILSPTLDMGGGFEAIADNLDVTPHCAIFVPFRPATVLIRDELLASGYKCVEMLRGGVTTAEQNEILARVKAEKGILVCTISYAESWDFETCATSYFLGYEYMLDINQQAEGRTQRPISAQEFVTWNYLRYNNTIDEDFLDGLSADLRNTERVQQRPKEFIEWLKGHKQ